MPQYPKLLALLRRDFKRVLAEIGTPIRICWKEFSTGSDYDPELESTWGDAEEQEVTIKALVHYVAPERIIQRGFTEIEAGDAILDVFHDDFDPIGKDDVRILIQNKWWTAKPVSGALAESWDVSIGGEGISRTFLISPSK